MATLTGLSIIGQETVSPANSATSFRAVNPATGDFLEPAYSSASLSQVESAVQRAADAASAYGKLSGKEKGRFLRSIAEGLEGAAEELVARAHLESALPLKRLQGELARTTNQLRLFAQVAEEGSWVQARIDPAQPDRKPLPRADIRSMLRPLGPVVVFGASNFPLAFSVAGGDTASAFAAGNPVLVKAHPAHPGTSEIVGRIIAGSVHTCGLPAGVFSLLFDAGVEVATALVQHPWVKAVGFTGSLAAGKALMRLAAERPDPIPCFTEMSSSNPLVVLPEALAERGTQIAAGLYESFTLGVGQFCTKPGLVFLPADSSADTFVAELTKRTAEGAAAVMLTPGICGSFHTRLNQHKAHDQVQVLAEAAQPSNSNGASAVPALLQTTGDALLKSPELAHEVFGPSTLVVRYADREQLLALARAMEGQLTASLHGTESDLMAAADLVEALQQRAGRIVFNGFPTGVEVCHAMVHGGPFPATSDSRWTSVGSQAIYRFSRPVCYQDFPEAALPDELKSGNPLDIWRLINGNWTRDAVMA
ncbi:MULTISPECIES: aldehyde dehydrogenase (NADP(+)) [Acidobacterium]|uniref:NADP-dependent fatty aldehyde dehydrogenase n=1 Tax=Acidobacterium capsulatum (strain ATCC 51196 / DSM 11244 / BCRC 80197 / JCM 7670 / NBRC 15755 / NCIMB 13165 / 161) TaxID=240015 RepID=C1F341_ACIC5|nr:MULTISPECIES: aldehyde dehydrogenase (NADP(+)) [Acidobacterium]ACO33021.1 NADP-dependent fatty aldehyde dehydrogenase [Acidobacterium capsulatum ATCC 51196]HCT61408.1 aldehyde dehydrogenase (NADP(+)) [Acidobacterium sp.]